MGRSISYPEYHIGSDIDDFFERYEAVAAANGDDDE
jgi:hypothetical protein